MKQNITVLRRFLTLYTEYGMSVTSPIKQRYEYNGYEFIPVDIDLDKAIETYHKKGFLNYQYGVWVTAGARYELRRGMGYLGSNTMKKSQIVYVDTDSCKYVGEANFTKYNREMLMLSKQNNATAKDSKGKEHYMGAFEDDGDYKKFVSLGAKKYAYVDQDDTLHLTVSGVNKKLGAEELQEAGGIEAFKEGFTFYKGGGTEAVYNDLAVNEYIMYNDIKITRNVCIKDSTYTLGITDEYRQLLEDLYFWVELDKEHDLK